MAPRSPTHAFDPTPALAHNHYYSPLNDHDAEEGNREVRFSDPPVSKHGRHSIATSNVPLLPPVASAGQVPKTAFRITNPTPGIDITAYFEQCRNVNEQLRRAHEEERRAWEMERDTLKSRIADLEFNLNRARASGHLPSIESSLKSAHPFKKDFRLGSTSKETNGFKAVISPPSQRTHMEPPVWQPESQVPVTRVFSQEDDSQSLPGIAEQGPLRKDLDNMPSGTQVEHREPPENVPIPIEKVEPELDGITVKSEGIKSSFNKVMSPLFGSPECSPSSGAATQEVPSLRIDSKPLLDPMDEKLRRNAGHTPLVFDGALSSSQTTNGMPTPRQEQPPAPAPTTRPPLRPSENSDSYFSFQGLSKPEEVIEEETKDEDEEAAKTQEEDSVEETPQFEPEEDHALKGPLMLDPSGRTEEAHTFLEQLDDKLEAVARKSREHSPIRNELPKSPMDTEMPRLRMKKSTNFGSAYGFKMPGRAF